jgi:adenylate cyclase
MARPRFSLRWKIALLSAGLLLMGVAALSVITVYLPWQQRLANQRHLALDRVRPLSPTIVRLSSEGLSFRADVMRDLVVNSSSAPGQELLYALLYDDKGELIETASVANTRLLSSLEPRLLALYRTDPRRALEALASRRANVQRLTVTLKLEGNAAPVGRMLLGLDTALIDAQAEAELLRELIVLAAALALAMIAATLTANRIARPLSDLSRAMGRMKKGELDVELEVQSRAGDEIGDLARAFNEMLQGLRERERLRGTLGRYVSGDVAERVLSERDDISLRGETRHVVVLFLDVRGFSSLSELLTPQELVALLNDYFHVMIDSVQRSGGVVNKFIGDAALCLWGAPRVIQDPELAAVKAALEMQRGANALSESRVARGLPVVGFGIGINAGEALAGNLGTAQRLEYTVIGDAVNLAQRLEAHAKAGEVLVSESIFEKVSAQIELERREPVRLKGKSEPVPLWEVRGLRLGAALLLFSCLSMPIGCSRDQGSASSDELTITVRGDRRELELQEQQLQQRERELRSEKDQIDARIAQLVKSVPAGNGAASDELNTQRQRERDIAARVQSVLAEKDQIDARKSAIAFAATPVDTDKVTAREAAVAAREAQLSERSEAIAKREQSVAARELLLAEAERTVNTRANELKNAPPPPPSRDLLQATAIEARHKKLLEDLAARGVLIADLPVEDQPLNADIWAARRQGDLPRASDLLVELQSAVKQLKIDQRFVEQKMVRLQRQRAAAKLNDRQRDEVEGLLREVTASYSDGKFDGANRGLNRIASILDASTAPG